MPPRAEDVLVHQQKLEGLGKGGTTHRKHYITVPLDTALHK